MVKDELGSVTAWGKKLLCSLMVQQWILLYRQQGEQAVAVVGIVF